MCARSCVQSPVLRETNNKKRHGFSAAPFLSLKSYFYYFYLYMCIHMFTNASCVHVCVPLADQKGMLDPLELDLQAIVRSSVYELGTEPGFSS